MRRHGIDKLTDVRAKTEAELEAIVGSLGSRSDSITARTVTIKVRYSDFTTITRSQSTREPTAELENIVARALKLLEKTEVGSRPVRLLGVSVHNFGRHDEKEHAAEESNGRLPFCTGRWVFRTAQTPSLRLQMLGTA